MLLQQNADHFPAERSAAVRLLIVEWPQKLLLRETMLRSLSPLKQKKGRGRAGGG